MNKTQRDELLGVGEEDEVNKAQVVFSWNQEGRYQWRRVGDLLQVRPFSFQAALFVADKLGVTVDEDKYPDPYGGVTILEWAAPTLLMSSPSWPITISAPKPCDWCGSLLPKDETRCLNCGGSK